MVNFFATGFGFRRDKWMNSGPRIMVSCGQTLFFRDEIIVVAENVFCHHLCRICRVWCWNTGCVLLPLRSTAFIASFQVPFYLLHPVLRTRDILVRIRIRGSLPLTNRSGSNSGSGPWYFRQWPARWQLKIILKLHLHNFSKIKSHEVTKQQELWFFLLFLLDYRRIRIRTLN